MEAVEVVRWVTSILLAVLGLAAVRMWVRRRTEAAAWLAACFACLGLGALAGRVVPDDGGPIVVERLLGVLILVVPYLLFRFADTFRPTTKAVRVAAAVLTLLVHVPLLVIADLGTPGAYTASQLVYILLVLAYWTALSTWTVVVLWRAGRGEPGVARVRVRLLAGAAALLNMALIAAVAVPAEGGPLIGVLISQGLAVTSIGAFLLAFAPPGILRREWRRQEERALRHAERELMAETTAAGVAAVLVPRIAESLGCRCAVLLDHQGRILGAHPELAQVTRLAARALDAAMASPMSGRVVDEVDLTVLELANGRLALAPSPYSPYFGSEEIALLEALAPSIDLAFERVTLYEGERRARLDVEEAKTELEGLLYGISHDLRTPLVALNGYADILAEELGEAQTSEVLFILERLRANVRYMDDLINDLLELSRIGRIEERAEPVDLAVLVREIAAGLEAAHPQARVVSGPLPVLRMSPVRARQLLSNLIQNAMKHGGRPDITVHIDSTLLPGEGVTVSVSDDGCGIPDDYREKVFGIFERLQARDSDDPGGTGIGLAICRRIVEQAGGSVDIVDAPVGTRFDLTFPASVVLDPAVPLETTS